MAHKKRILRIADQTLRDGEQQVGIVFSIEEKIKIAKELTRAGVAFIALMAVTHPTESQLVQDLCLGNLPIVVDVPLGIDYINQAHQLGAKRITLFTSTSDILLQAKNISKKENTHAAIEMVKYAHSLGLVIDFAFEDASRADMDYIVDLALSLKSYIDYLIVCDTVGCLQPNLTQLWITELLQRTRMNIGVHFHNDLGLAVENSVHAILSGATLISGTLTGIGERAGNTAIEETLSKLRAAHGFEVEQIDLDSLETVCQMVKQYAGRPPALPMSSDAFYTQTGIHVNALLKNPLSYLMFPNIESEVWFGKYSGMSNFRLLFEVKLGQTKTEQEYACMRDKVKQLSIECKKTFSMAEVIEMYQRGEL